MPKNLGACLEVQTKVMLQSGIPWKVIEEKRQFVSRLRGTVADLACDRNVSGFFHARDEHLFAH